MTSASHHDGTSKALWVQCACTALVALGAAYASYRHGREFALRFGADASTASIWPLIVDGLLTTATVELWKTGSRVRGRWVAWGAFVFGISLSLCANIGAAPTLSLFSVTVAACPPIALLFAVELLNRALKCHRDQTAEGVHPAATACSEASAETPEIPAETVPAARLATVPDGSVLPAVPTAEQRMWAHYVTERAKGRIPTGAELDRIAGTNNYGRRILRQWRAAGHGPPGRNRPASTREVTLVASAG
ncbi:DUF2637 domain-containing protein [Amycolatopsis sp. NPDC051128]|uniref:DUF2637 domain-containing protein n=1 Tax=Amycolatopsis sp. NPDC051128 TaxID=3155412 RepID=UPI00342DBEB7